MTVAEWKVLCSKGTLTWNERLAENPRDYITDNLKKAQEDAKIGDAIYFLRPSTTIIDDAPRLSESMIEEILTE